MSNDCVMVPRVPTRAMLNAAIDAHGLKLGCIGALGFRRSPQWMFEQSYAAMLAAAPAPPDTANAPEHAAILKLRGKMSQRAESQHFNEWDARAAVEHVDALRAEVERLRQGLWDCFAAAGGDTDGDATPAAQRSDLVALALGCVRDLRGCYDDAAFRERTTDEGRSRE